MKNKKQVLITGAGGGLGTAVTRRFLEEGYSVAALVDPGREEEKRKSLEKATAKPENLSIYPVDAMDGAAVKSFIEKHYEKGQLHAAILIVGGFGMGDIHDTTEEDLNNMIQLNFKTAFHFTKNSLPVMAEGGRFVLIGARPALDPSAAKGMIAYSISKGMVVQLADIINEEGKDRNIQAALILPSIIDTPANRKAMPDADFNKWVRPEEIAEAMLYACSEAAAKQMAPRFKMYGGA